MVLSLTERADERSKGSHVNVNVKLLLLKISFTVETVLKILKYPVGAVKKEAVGNVYSL